LEASDARHLLRRCGHGSRPSDLSPFLSLTRSQAVAKVMNFSSNGVVSSMPAELADDSMGIWRQNAVIANWWIERWKNVAAPLEEKLLWFFHDHFATSSRKLEYGHQMWDQLIGIRANLLGNYPQMVQGVAKSAAMLMYLDNWRNRVGRPNENFARELMELHVLGRDNYSEMDIVEGARAWTGHGLDDDKRYYKFNPRDHDDRQKTIFGVSKAWDGPQVIDYMFTNATLRNHAARHLATSMWMFFASEEPNEAAISRMASRFISSGWNLAGLVSDMFMSDEFYSSSVKNSLARAPMEWVSDLMRSVGLGTDITRPEWYLGRMGQRPFGPPSPAGWGSSDQWLTVTCEWAKGDFARRLTWKIDEAGFMDGAKDMPPGQSVARTLDAFGLGHVCSQTRRTLEDYVVAERGRRGWAEQVNLLTLTMMSPECGLA